MIVTNIVPNIDRSGPIDTPHPVVEIDGNIVKWVGIPNGTASGATVVAISFPMFEYDDTDSRGTFVLQITLKALEMVCRGIRIACNE